MKADVFKKLIKEAVREALKEELAVMLSEKVEPTPVSTFIKYENYKPVTAKPVSTGDPIADLLQETRAAMTQGEYRNITSMTSDMVSGGVNPMQQFNPGPEPGINLDSLDFVKNAGAIFKASVEKDKQRFGA
jgi:hypothetical protein